MKVVTEELSPTKKKLDVEIPRPQVRKVVDSLYRDLQKRVKIRGFRPGKTPRNVLERYYGDYVREKATSQLIGETYAKAISRESLDPVAPPIIDTGELRPEKAFSYTAVVEVTPAIEVREYKGLKLQGRKPEVSSGDIGAELKRLREVYSQLRSVQRRRTVRKGDVLLLDFQGFLEKRPIRDGKAENYTLEVGSGAMVPGFEEALIGKKTGVEHELRVTLPVEHQRQDLAGKEVTFVVTVKEIREKVLPALDDEFAKDVGNYGNLDELKKKLQEDLQSAKERLAKEELKRAAIDKVVETNPIDLPSYLVERRTQEMMQDLKFRWQSERKKDLPLPQEQALQRQYQTVAERDVAASLLLEQIARQEAIEVTEEEVQQRLEQFARAYNRPLGDLKRDPAVSAAVRRSIERDKVLDFLIDQAEIRWSRNEKRKTRAKK